VFRLAKAAALHLALLAAAVALASLASSSHPLPFVAP